VNEHNSASHPAPTALPINLRGRVCCAQEGALTTAELCDALGLQELKERKWHVQGSIAVKGEGLYEVPSPLHSQWYFNSLSTVSSRHSRGLPDCASMCPGHASQLEWICKEEAIDACARKVFWCVTAAEQPSCGLGQTAAVATPSDVMQR